MMYFIERFTLNRAWNGLSDEEVFWEPVPGSWSVRPIAECRTRTPFLIGEWAADMDSEVALGADGITTFEPLTTIGWLLWHVGSMPGRAAELDFLGGTHTAESGWTSPYLALHPIFTTADEAVGAMRTGWRALGAALGDATDDQLERPTRFWGYGGPGRMGTGAQILASTLN
ncbi:MAG: hypothetical protein QOD30_330, partial [Actinomycetota bacterium]|nr:hypothetical protein [Actinomycetota bacterium]